MNIKEQLYKQCCDFVESRLTNINNVISEIQVSLQSETKSSAGDKHETGRAMLQLEREKAGNQLAEIQNIKEILSKVDTNKVFQIVGLGSVVYTTQSNYFISISAGEINANQSSFYAISPSTPIGQILLTKKAGDVIVFRDQEFKIIKDFLCGGLSYILIET